MTKITYAGLPSWPQGWYMTDTATERRAYQNGKLLWVERKNA